MSKKILNQNKNQKTKKPNLKEKGYLKEQIVAKALTKQGWTIIYQNKKILGVEIDILAKKGREHILVEVKSLKQTDQLNHILKNKQKNRLEKVIESLAPDYPKGVKLWLAVVDKNNKTEFFEISNL